MNREQWLTGLAKKLEPLFKKNAAELPAYRISCSWPSRGGLAKRNRTIGQCWDAKCSADKTTEIMISMAVSDPLEAGAILVHEMVHAAVGLKAGHKAPFKRLAVAVGLEGKMTATNANKELREHLNTLVGKLGNYPHAALDGSSRPKQKTRLIKAECSKCGYTIRVTQKWVDVAIPICPVHFETEMELG